MNHEEYLKLAEEIRRHGDLYYNQDAPEISDYEYDAMMQRLIEAEQQHPDWIQPDSPSRHVGGDSGKSSFEKVSHRVPMLSLQDVFTETDVESFLRANPGERFSVEEKIDGLSMSATYQNGILTRAETRGDGYIGEDITENARHIHGIPQRLKKVPGIENLDELEVRFEVYLPVEEFERINAEHEVSGKRIFVNPRNAAAGILRTKDILAVKAANLHAFAFNVQRFSLRDPAGADGSCFSGGFQSREGDAAQPGVHQRSRRGYRRHGCDPQSGLYHSRRAPRDKESRAEAYAGKRDPDSRLL